MGFANDALCVWGIKILRNAWGIHCLSKIPLAADCCAFCTSDVTPVTAEKLASIESAEAKDAWFSYFGKNDAKTVKGVVRELEIIDN